jgi:UPF0755 protein
MIRKKVIISTLVFFVLTVTVLLYLTYKVIFADNISSQAPDYLYIKTGSTYSQIIDLLNKENVIKNLKTFQLVSKWKKYPQKIKAGRYVIKHQMNNNELVNMLRSGNQEAVNFTFNNVRTKELFVQKVSQQLEMHSDSLLSFLNNTKTLEKYKLNKDNVLTIFIPNTYKIWWNISCDEFIKKMYREYERFWTEERKQKSVDINLTPMEISILASIVEEENHRTDEQARIAGVYINRLKKGIHLQADPTIKFALQDFGRKRLLYADLEIDSPYNTYKYMGLPPGLIRIPSPTCIDKVLNYEQHNYIFMCAKEDFSGYHNFAVTLSEHAANAAKYHNALNMNKIKR